MDVWIDDQHQSQEIGWDLGQAASQRTGALSIKENFGAAHRLGSAVDAPQNQLQAESQDLHPSSEVRNSTEAAGLPEDFDWQAYLAYYPDLVSSGISSELNAQEHYLNHGRQEGRIHRRLKVLMHYTACTGLINQHYSHIAAFTLSSAVGAELVLPQGLQRDSFASYFSAHKEQNEVTWTSMSTSKLLDVDRITEEWGARGMEVHKVSTACPSADSSVPRTRPSSAALSVPATHSYPSRLRVRRFHGTKRLAVTRDAPCQHLLHPLSDACCMQTPPQHSLPNVGEPDTAYPQYQQSPEEERLTVRLSDIYLKVCLTQPISTPYLYLHIVYSWSHFCQICSSMTGSCGNPACCQTDVYVCDVTEDDIPNLCAGLGSSRAHRKDTEGCDRACSEDGAGAA